MKTKVKVLSRSRKAPFAEAKIESTPDNAPSVYFLMAENGYVNFIGQTSSLPTSLREHLLNGRFPVASFRYIITKTKKEAAKLEHELIEEYEPYYNVRA